MYGRGMSQRDIAQTIDEIYGFKLSAEQISNITDYVVEAVEEWQTRPLDAFYPFAFVDCMYVSMRTERGVRNVAVYTVLAYTVNGRKDILGLWIGDTESKHFWMQVFDELKSRGVEDLGFLSIDGVSGLEAGAKSIFPHVVVQRCIVHLIRNSTKYIPRKDWSRFTKDCTAPSTSSRRGRTSKRSESTGRPILAPCASGRTTSRTSSSCTITAGPCGN